MDITFETLDFSDKIILPASSKNNGYISMNADIEFCGEGSFELVFRDDEVEGFIRKYREDGLLLTWGDFQGYFTDYQFKTGKKSVYGSHINSLLHKFVVIPQTIDGDIKEAVYSIISDYTPFTPVENDIDFGTTAYSTDKCLYADDFLIKLLENHNLGYRLFIENKTIYFEFLKSSNNPLMLSEGNLNVYEFQEDYSNKNIVYGGWYFLKYNDTWMEDTVTPVENPKWTHIELENKSGIFSRDVMLESNTPKGALAELETKTSMMSELICKTKNIKYKEDYNLGDIVRYYTNGITVNKKVTKISLWYEGSSYHEEPTLTEWEDKDV